MGDDSTALVSCQYPVLCGIPFERGLRAGKGFRAALKARVAQSRSYGLWACGVKAASSPARKALWVNRRTPKTTVAGVLVEADDYVFGGDFAGVAVGVVLAVAGR